MVAQAWYQECIDDGIWSSEKHRAVIKESLQNHAYPTIGDTPIKEVTASDVRSVARKIARAGTWETAQRVLQRIHTVFVWAEDEDNQDMVDRALFTMLSIASQLGLKISWKDLDE